MKNYGKAVILKIIKGIVTVFCRGKDMSDTIFVEKLAYFKQNEKPEVVLLIADKPEPTRIIIAWTNISVGRVNELIPLSSDSERETWEWLWQNTKYSLTELKEKADISVADYVLKNKMKSLIGNRILYPDGTINSYVQRYLKERVIKLFEAKSKKAVTRT
jgi:hypothetical protein